MDINNKDLFKVIRELRTQLKGHSKSSLQGQAVYKQLLQVYSLLNVTDDSRPAGNSILNESIQLH